MTSASRTTNPPTYLNVSSSPYSAIDITLSDPSSYMDYKWKVHNNPCGSDHFSLIIETTHFFSMRTDLPVGKQIRPNNDIWKSSRFPESQKLVTIIPIPNPGKNSLYPSNYGPIALTNCLCKTMKCIVNKRLVWFIESNNFLSFIVNSQCGFRNQRSTMDHEVRLEAFISNIS